ncbi:hypothetical protein BC937DRAFT_88978, partial [Endogone sp. FLAS-F59071]
VTLDLARVTRHSHCHFFSQTPIPFSRPIAHCLISSSRPAIPTTMTQWNCDYCTFLNIDNALACTMCYRTRPSARELPVQKKKKKKKKKIPYDRAASIQIETAYQSSQPKVALTQGYFADFPGDYDVLFNRTTRAFVQVNVQTRRRRPMRRIANDDNSILIPVSFAAISSEHVICAICQNRLDEISLLLESDPVSASSSSAQATTVAGSFDESPPSYEQTLLMQQERTNEASPHEPVRLPQCAPGHYFHRGCVAQAIKLKDQCPGG